MGLLNCLTCLNVQCDPQLVEEFRSLSREIISLAAIAHFTMVRLDCEELKQGLANKAKNFAEILLKKLITSHREQNIQ